MARIGIFTVTYDDDTEQVVDWKRIDLVRYEQQFEKTSGALDGMVDQYRMAWLALRRAGKPVPETFEAFLELAPDVDLETEDDVGKDSGPTASNG